MKKIFCLALTTLLCCAFVACSEKNDENPPQNPNENNGGNNNSNGDNNNNNGGDGNNTGGNGENNNNENKNKCTIVYTSEDNQLLRFSSGAFNADVISHEYINGQGVIVFDAPITRVGYEAFADCSRLYTIKLPSTVTEIEDKAFINCSKLSSINIPSEVEKIGREAFYNCSKLETIKIPAAVTSIGSNAFSQCTSLFRVYCLGSIPPETSYFSFSNNARLRRFYVPDSSVYLYRSEEGWRPYAGCILSIEDEGVKRDFSSITYTIDGETYSMVKVEGDLPPYYIMQTEIPVDAEVTIAGVYLGKLVRNNDDVLIKADFRDFRDELVVETGIDFRLPTPEEWQYAAQGGAASKHYTYSGSNDIDNVAWYYRNSEGKAHKVAQKQANELGLYDMSGNYAELCNDYPVDVWNVDGPAYGGNWSSDTEDCLPSSYVAGVVSGELIGTTGKEYKELNATKCDKKAIRLVVDAED